MLATAVPSNRDWNARWVAFLAAPLDPDRAASLPPDTAVARDVVVAAHAAAAGEEHTLAVALLRLRTRGVLASRAEALRCRTEATGGP